jgi:hypothetical protein
MPAIPALVTPTAWSSVASPLLSRSSPATARTESRCQSQSHIFVEVALRTAGDAGLARVPAEPSAVATAVPPMPMMRTLPSAAPL